MTDTNLVPVDDFEIDTGPSMVAQTGPREVSPSLEMLFDPIKFAQAEHVANLLARSESVTPQPWIGKPAACFTVVTMAYNWGLCPFAVMGAAFPLPGGKMGLQGKLIRAIFKQSRAFRALPTPKFLGDWNRVIGKFAVKQSTRSVDEHGKPKTYTAPTWTAQDNELRELGVELTYQLHGHGPETYSFMLHQVGIMFATTWATDPMGQLYNAACRALASSRVPWIVLGGAIFDGDVIPSADPPTQVGAAAVPEPAGDPLDGFVKEQQAKKTDASKPSAPPPQPEMAGPRPAGQPAPQLDPALAPSMVPMFRLAIVGNRAPMQFSEMADLLAYARRDLEDNRAKPAWVKHWKKINAELLQAPEVAALLAELEIE